jgi:Uncharacterised nucleotidyltransferase
MTGTWEAVDPLIAGLDADAARAHGVAPLVAQRLRAHGEPVPEILLREERAAQMTNLIAPSVLGRARAAYDGPMLVLKGPEVAALYPGRARLLADLDLLVDDAQAAFGALLAAGFVPADRLNPVGPQWYHLNAIELPGFPLAIELHKSFRAASNGLRPPPNDALFAAAVPASVGVEGLLAPTRAQHAVLLAGHAWAERPLGRLRDLIDVAVMAEPIDRDELSRIAAEWGWDRLWRTTMRAIDWLLGDGERPGAARIWARYLAKPREPTRVELHLRRFLAPFWALPAPTALHEAAFQLKLSLMRPPTELIGH